MMGRRRLARTRAVAKQSYLARGCKSPLAGSSGTVWALWQPQSTPW